MISPYDRYCRVGTHDSTVSAKRRCALLSWDLLRSFTPNRGMGSERHHPTTWSQIGSRSLSSSLCPGVITAWPKNPALPCVLLRLLGRYAWDSRPSSTLCSRLDSNTARPALSSGHGSLRFLLPPMPGSHSFNGDYCVWLLVIGSAYAVLGCYARNLTRSRSLHYCG